MKKNSINISGVMLSILTVFSFSSTQAQTCVQPPSCEDLGYSQTLSDCLGVKRTLKCPFDKSKMYCQINPTECIVGSALYGDGHCYEMENYPMNVEPIGVVFDTTKRLAVALRFVQSTGVAGNVGMKWATGNCDEPSLSNCSASNIGTCGVDGKQNTEICVDEDNKCGYKVTAAWAAYDYSPNSCAASFCRQGKWFLPSIKELTTLYSNKATIEETLSKLSDVAGLSSYIYWSSTEYDYMNVWQLNMGTGTVSKGTKSGEKRVRPIINY